MKYTCSCCRYWNIGFDNSCSERARLYGDWSDQPSDKPACKLFKKE